MKNPTYRISPDQNCVFKSPKTRFFVNISIINPMRGSFAVKKEPYNLPCHTSPPKNKAKIKITFINIFSYQNFLKFFTGSNANRNGMDIS